MTDLRPGEEAYRLIERLYPVYYKMESLLGYGPMSDDENNAKDNNNDLNDVDGDNWSRGMKRALENSIDEREGKSLKTSVLASPSAPKPNSNVLF